MIRSAICLALLAFLLTNGPVTAQCSDAGVCVIGKNQTKETEKNTSTVSLGYVYGTSGKQADVNGSLNNIKYGSVRFEADLDILKNARMNVSIPYTFVSGPLGENNGIGDLAVLFTKKFYIEKVHELSFSIGGKFATGSVNSKDSLPQRYMTGLGTNDLIVGATYTYGNYYFGIGYQKPFGRSVNYDTRLKRGDDAFMRAGFFEQFGKLSLKAEVLTIVRIQPSSVRDPVGTGESFINISGSNEAQVNLLATVNFMASKKVGLWGQGALPLLTRNYNYDGLKRSLSLAAGVTYYFSLK
ncbi:MAG: hypothetical protein IT281_00360 [Ignavibacteria bacterium]|nr:hypothetical protein [Ignavibacteria bacterium]